MASEKPLTLRVANALNLVSHITYLLALPSKVGMLPWLTLDCSNSIVYLSIALIFFFGY
jgi:hypothetical protein